MANDYSISQCVIWIKLILENPNYNYRTIEEISRELNMPEDLVERTLKSKDLENEVIEFYLPNNNKQIVYAIKSRYRKTRPLISRMIDSVLMGFKRLEEQNNVDGVR